MIALILLACSAPVETDTDAVAETERADTDPPVIDCAPAWAYVMYDGPDCTGNGYAADTGADGPVEVVSLYSVSGMWCEPFDAHLEFSTSACP